MSASRLFDVLIVGGGPAGLSCAQALCRQMYHTVVFDAGFYRNDPTTHMHNFPTWDHKPPSEFRIAARKNMERYNSTQFVERRLTEIRKVNEYLFEAKDETGEIWRSQAVVLAPGVKDVFPNIKGYEQVWGKAIFHCLFCHGYEERGGQSCGIMAAGMMSAPPMALHGARMSRNLAKSPTIYTNGDPESTPKMVAFFEPRGIKVETRKIVSVSYNPESVDARLIVTFEDGETKGEAFMLDHPKTEINGPFMEQLGLEMGEMGIIQTMGPFYETSVKGVYAIGDVATPMKAVAQGVVMGGFAAAGVASRLGALAPGLGET